MSFSLSLFRDRHFRRRSLGVLGDHRGIHAYPLLKPALEVGRGGVLSAKTGQYRDKTGYQDEYVLLYVLPLTPIF
jgi:hypothetical protein